eukprot:30457_1
MDKPTKYYMQRDQQYSIIIKLQCSCNAHNHFDPSYSLLSYFFSYCPYEITRSNMSSNNTTILHTAAILFRVNCFPSETTRSSIISRNSIFTTIVTPL